jgi:hypothetical protein
VSVRGLRELATPTLWGAALRQRYDRYVQWPPQLNLLLEHDHSSECMARALPSDPYGLRKAVLGTLASALSRLAWVHAHETLIWASKGSRSRYTFNYDLINSQDPSAQLSSVWHIPSVPKNEKLFGYHPTQKPLRLLRRAILASTREGELVFDPFCGSGSSGVASKELDRFFVGAEKEQEYAELAGRRIGAADRGVALAEIPELGQRERF